MAALTDKSPMPFGKYKGERMIDIPDSYLIFLYKEGKCNTEVKKYIEEFLDVSKVKYNS